MRKRFSVILLGILLLTLCSCVKTSIDTNKEINTPVVATYPKAIAFDDFDAKQKLQEENPVDKKFIKAVNEFSYDTTQALIKDNADNFNYSPLSLYYALALAGTGAGGETQQQIFDLLGVSSTKELSTQCGNLYRLLYTDNRISKLKIANSLWLNDDTDFKSSFVSNAADHFYASAFSIDFSDSDSAKVMAEWISENTNGTITPDLNINPEQIMSIINTIYFYDEWTDGFDQDLTQEDIFHADNTEVKADFMNQTVRSSEFVRGNNYTRSSLSLKNNGQMVFILPDQGVSVSDLISSKKSIRVLFEGGKTQTGQVVWKIPKFKFASSFKLADTLQTLGMTNAFNSDADFLGITDGFASISDILQQTHIAIDEKGVEASAFTQIDFFGCVATQPKDRAEMILNRPFLYGITSSDGTLLFVGVCNNPSL